MPVRRHFIKIGLSILLWPAVLASASAATDPADSPSAATDQTPSAGQILVIGDSLSAEYGLPAGTGWVAQIKKYLQNHDTGYQIHNSSISGDTSSGGLSRIGNALARYRPDIIIIELGSNDALRGLSLTMTHKNLAQMIQLSQQSKADVLLVGMQIPPNYGKSYADQFAQIFPELASDYQTALVPFLLEGFGTQRAMFQDDAIHPNEQGQRIMANTIWKYLEPMLQKRAPG